MECISHHIMSLVISSLRGRHTTYIYTWCRQNQFLETGVCWLQTGICLVCMCKLCILLIICGGKASCFIRITLQPWKLLVNICIWILWKLVKAGNRKHFLGNECKDMKQQNFSTSNNKQYRVFYSCEWGSAVLQNIHSSVNLSINMYLEYWYQNTRV